MAYFKPLTLNGFSLANMDSISKAKVDLKNGQVVVVDGENATLPTTTEKTTSDLYFVWNHFTGDDTGMDETIVKGKHLRTFYIPNWNKQYIQLNELGVKYTGSDEYKDIAVGDVLEVNEEGKLEKVGTPSADIQFKVAEKIHFGNDDNENGFLLQINVI